MQGNLRMTKGAPLSSATQAHRGTDSCNALHRGRVRMLCAALVSAHGVPSRQQTRSKLTEKTVACHAEQRKASARLSNQGNATDVAQHTKTRTQEIFEGLEERRASSQQAGGAGGGTTFEALQKADAAWARIRSSQPGKGQRPEFVKERRCKYREVPEFDVIVCGGTLGIFLGCALQMSGFRVAVVERGPLKGRDQEWNISRKEVAELVHEGLLTAEEAEQCIGVEFNPVRAGFHGGVDVWTRDVLNIGVRPDKMIDKVKSTFVAGGGKVFEMLAGEAVDVYENAAVLQIPSQPGQENVNQSGISGRLLIDCMGNFSPIVRQMRWAQKPDGVCLVVGTCSRGFKPENNTTGDIIVTNTPIQPSTASVPDVQYFWEAFPAGSGPSDRTTYMFTYIDAHPDRPSLLACLEDYWTLMPEYQDVDLDSLEVLRILFGFFPTYRNSPLQPEFDRIMQIGDASGIQSPLSFGGFGAMARHLPRLRTAISQALQADRLDKAALASISPYNPGLSGAWMLQRAMSVRPGQQPRADFINHLLSANFSTMSHLGEPVLKPFLQDVVQFGPLGVTLFNQMLEEPGLIPQILAHVGLVPLLDWTRHFLALGLFTGLYKALKPLDGIISQQLNPHLRFTWKRQLEALEYGSGSDYSL